MTTETLRCRCGIEVRIVRLTPRITALGHVTNPRQNSHTVLLAKSADDASSIGLRGSRRPSRVHEDAPLLIANGKRAARKGTGPDRTSADAPSSGTSAAT